MPFAAGDTPTAAELNAVSIVQTAVLAADQTRTSSTTLTNLSGMTASTAASSKYAAQIFLIYGGSTTGDIKFGYTLPASATFEFNPMSIFSTDSSLVAATPYMGILNTSGGAAGGGIGAGTKALLLVTGIVVTGATAGTFQLQFAQNTSDGTATTVYAGSWMLVHKLA